MMRAARLVNVSVRCRCTLQGAIPNSRTCAQTFFKSSPSPSLLPAHPLHQKYTKRSLSSSFTKTEYIHPLSQIVLAHLQNNHSEWVKSVGLDKGLEVKKDGTFVLRFPQATEADDNSAETKKGSIWTMYEAEESKHYLCVRNGNLIGRYMLQDNKKPAWHTDKRSTPERVQQAVDEMILKMKS